MTNQARSRILYVEPPATSTQPSLTKLLSGKYDVHALSGKSSVLDAAQKDTYALFIVDEEQSDTDGFELCQELRKLDAQTPMLVYCSSVARRKLRRVAQAGAQWCLSKPVDSYCLLSAVNWLIGSTTGNR
jgi:DNA-binding response OmpR family regulator